MSHPEPEPLPFPFPVLGIRWWPGKSKVVMRHGTGSLTGDGGVGEPAVVSVTHAYYLPGHQHATVTIGQAPALPGRDASSTAAAGSALSRLLGRRTGRPSVDSPVSMAGRPVLVEGAVLDAVQVDWGEPRITHVCFDWRDDRLIEIAAWEYPLDPGFFASLSVISA